jgi:hypothetical protein
VRQIAVCSGHTHLPLVDFLKANWAGFLPEGTLHSTMKDARRTLRLLHGDEDLRLPLF